MCIRDRLKGWQTGGLNGYNPQKLGFEKRSGKAGDYKSLSEKAAELGGRVIFYEDPMNVTQKQMVYSGNTAHTMSQMPVQITLENDTLLYNKRQFMGLDILADTLADSLKFYQKQSIANVAFGSLGGVLYADPVSYTHLSGRKKYPGTSSPFVHPIKGMK